MSDIQKSLREWEEQWKKEIDNLKTENKRLRAADRASEEYILVLIGVIKELGPSLPYTRLVEAERKYRIASVALEPKP